MKRHAIGFSGSVASGKTTAARLLEDEGFAYGRYSMVLTQALQEKGIQPSREALQEYGLYVNRELGQRWLGRQLLRLLPGDQNIVVDGMRFPDDHAMLVESFGLAFQHIHLDAGKEIRRRRYESKEFSGTPFDVADSHEVELGTALTKALGRVEVVDNDSDFDRFSRAIKGLVRR